MVCETAGEKLFLVFTWNNTHQTDTFPFSSRAVIATAAMAIIIIHYQ